MRGLYAAGVVAAVAKVAALLARGNAAWGSFATARGLRFMPAVPGWMGARSVLRVDGAQDGVPFALLLYPDHVSQYFGTAVLAFPPRPVPGHLEVTRAGALSRIATAFGAQDLEVGVATFDAAFVVKGTNVTTARRLLSPSLCAEFLALEAQFLGYDDGSEPQHSAHAMLEISGVVTDGAILDRASRTMTAFARTA